MRTTKSITRSANTSIPATISPVPVLYGTADGQTLLWDILGQGGLQADQTLVEIAAKMPGESERYRLHYAYIGGKNQHTVELRVEGADAGTHDIEWLYVRSYTGGQIKFMKKDKEAKALFAMAEEDAYMFCQNDPCIECAFACKLGFEFYAYSTSEGLLKDTGKVRYTNMKQNH